jgi:hypothetical protein
MNPKPQEKSSFPKLTFWRFFKPFSLTCGLPRSQSRFPKPRSNMATLSDAITAVEQASTAYSSAAATVTNDVAAAAAISTKLDAANAQTATDTTTQGTAKDAFNASLDALVAAATAAKLP